MDEERTMQHWPRSLALCLAFAGLFPLRAGESAWPEYHGLRRDNVSHEKGLLRRWPEGGPPLLWRYDQCGKGFSTVSIAGGRIYTAGDFGDTERVLALDLKGTLLWQAPNGRSWRRATPGSRATPTVRDGTVYHMNPTGRLAAFSAATGKELWAVDLEERFGASYGAWALSESVVVEGDLVICMPGGTKGCLAALDRNTGATRWVTTEIADRAAYCSPAVVTHGGVRQVITLTRRHVVGVDVRTGKLLWSHPHETPYGVNVTTPLFRDGYVFVTGGYSIGGKLLKIDPADMRVTPVWAGGDLDNCHGGVFLIDGCLYGSGCRQSKKGLVCLDFKRGTTRWNARDFRKASLAFAEGLLYCLSDQRTVSLVAPDPDRLRIVSRFELPKEGRGPVLAHPVICGGRLYIRHDHVLFAYDIRKRPDNETPTSSDP
jgi:outer membrane protein assembly factor BamB